ncbi:MAG: amidohydrolase family protein [Novosphingobium sp.]|nr:amidohydrolase family protein [Novosphingobium sp.]
MTLDIRIAGATVYDGTGQDACTADIGIKDGKIAEIGNISTDARRTICADGAMVTPGFIDTHTHYDAQALWDSDLINSALNGVTTAVMGNCGVGCAPLAPGMVPLIKSLLEGVEDIPGQALDAAVDWDWDTFDAYLRRLEALPHTLNLAANATHAPIRFKAMGARALDGSAPTEDDKAMMQAMLAEALEAGACAFSTDRIALHQLGDGSHVPDWHAPGEEVLRLAHILKRFSGRPMQFASDFGGTVGTESDALRELALLRDITALGVPVLLPMQQYPKLEGGWRRLAGEVASINGAGGRIVLEASARAIGSLMGLEQFHPFLRHPGYMEIAALPLAERLERMRDPAFRARLLNEEPAADPNDQMASYKFEILANQADRIFIVDGTPDYEPDPATSVKAIARRTGRTIHEVFFDALVADEGRKFLYLIVFNFGDGNLDEQHAILSLPDTVFSFGDAGAHVTAACDFANTTFALVHWGRDRAVGFRKESIVHRQTGAQAKFFGFADRGEIRVGANADINVIDFGRLRLDPPRLLHDFPGGAKRLHQGASGYIATLVNGVPTVEADELTGALPGRILRS